MARERTSRRDSAARLATDRGLTVCVELPGRVVAVDGRGATIERQGIRRRAATLLVPEVAPGDWVLVGAGHVLRILPEPEARNLIDTIQTAAGRGGLQP